MDSLRLKSRWLGLAAAATIALALACKPSPQRVPVGQTANSPVSTSTVESSGNEEIWSACFVGGKKVGFTHFKTETRTRDDGTPTILATYSDKLVLSRFGTEMVMRTQLECVENTEGQLLSFRSQMTSGPQPIISEGELQNGKMVIRTSTAGNVQTQSVTWDESCKGFFADRQSLRDKPMKPGESRRLKTLLPVINQVGVLQLEAKSYEAVPLIDGSKQLLRVDATTIVTTDQGETKLKSVFWTDKQGNALKSRDLTVKIDAIVTTKEIAQGRDEVAEFDLGHDTVVRVEKPLEKPHKTKRVVYQATLRDGDVEKLFDQSLAQQVQMADDKTARVLVRAIRPDSPIDDEIAVEEPVKESREPTSMIQSDDDRIVRFASEISPQETDPWKLACELESFVHQKIRKKNYTTAMATAAEVAESLEGDCTEHAVLLAALCRARKIPARVAIGLVYYPAASGFAYHMWTEAWIKGRWIPLDATLGIGGIGGGHLKFADSNLQGASGFAEMLPVIQAIGRLNLKIVSVEH